MSKTIEHDDHQESLRYRDDNSGFYEQGFVRHGKSVASRRESAAFAIWLSQITLFRRVARSDCSIC